MKKRFFEILGGLFGVLILVTGVTELLYSQIDAPQSGDATYIALWVLLLVAAAGGIFWLRFRGKKKTGGVK